MSISEQKPPPIRTDLEIVPQYYRGELCYVAKDPVTLNYYRLGEVEYVVVKCFQQGMGVEQTQREVKRRTGAEISEMEIFKFADQLRSSGLLKSKGMEDVRRLSRHKMLARKQRIKRALSNYLFVTIPLWDPDRLLEKFLPSFRLVWNKYFLALWVVLTGTALWIMITNFSELVADAFSLLSGWNLLILSVVIFCVKFFHEMGHALTCKHYGGEVHAVGPAFLVFQPCMFTDTTDAWLFTSKWERIAVTAAGILAEVMLASLAAIIWISSPPGLLKQVAYTTMVACSVNTLLFNANPLIRFDGYYVLSDLMEIPNLRAKTSQYMNYAVDRHVLGLKVDPPRMQPGDPGIFLTYGILRQVYWLLLSFSIGLFLYSLFEPLGIFAWITTFFGIIVSPLWKKGKELARQYQSGSVRVRYLVVLAGALVIVAALWFVPIDYTVEAPCVVTPARISVVRTLVSGEVERVVVRPGARVEQGAELVIMRNEELPLRAELTRELRRETEARLQGTLDASPAAHEMLLREQLKLTQELGEIEKRIEQLTLRAPQDGVVVSLHRLEMRMSPGRHSFVSPDEDAEMEFEQLQGRTVKAGTGLIGVETVNPVVLEMFVQEHNLSYLSLGNKVGCVLRFDPGRVLRTDVAGITPVDVKTIENVGITLADVGHIPVKPAADGTSEPLVTLYMLKSKLIENRQGLPIGMTGKARITYGRGPIGSFYFGRIVRGLRLRMQEV